ncbi:hypothetical protein OCU04_003375 [Sclerotinia nivalis]|uniref:Heterokaryon incompatibility domain-containing protein n=1 Tax=Sclerotinia nivalis TaxID=352851 RepID=A0A9X0DLS8_9HELO|nr:hypothetical protein OCU04_003375 [Sclerotinia nivalis]
MRKFYERAEKVLVWLGREGEDSQQALLLANYLYQYRHSEKNLTEYVFENPQIAAYFTALKLLFSRHYWKRIWVVQEVTVAKDCLVLCGNKTIPLYVLIEAQEVMKSDQGQRALAL